MSLDQSEVLFNEVLAISECSRVNSINQLINLTNVIAVGVRPFLSAVGLIQSIN